MNFYGFFYFNFKILRFWFCLEEHFQLFFSQKFYGFCLCTIILTLWLIKSSFFFVGLELFNPWWFWIGLYPIWWCYSYSDFWQKSMFFSSLLLCFVDYCKKELTLSFIVYGYFLSLWFVLKLFLMMMNWQCCISGFCTAGLYRIDW